MDLLQTLGSVLVGVVTGALPLWIRLRNFQYTLKKKESDLDLEVSAKKAEQANATKINTEAEWKRILEYRDAELVTLRARDEAQDKQIMDLYNKHVDCEKERARNEAKIEAIEKHYGAHISKLESEIAELRILLKGFNNAVPQGTPAASSPPSVPVSDRH